MALPLIDPLPPEVLAILESLDNADRPGIFYADVLDELRARAPTPAQVARDLAARTWSRQWTKERDERVPAPRRGPRRRRRSGSTPRAPGPRRRRGPFRTYVAKVKFEKASRGIFRPEFLVLEAEVRGAVTLDEARAFVQEELAEALRRLGPSFYWDSARVMWVGPKEERMEDERTDAKQCTGRVRDRTGGSWQCTRDAGHSGDCSAWPPRHSEDVGEATRRALASVRHAEQKGGTNGTPRG